MFHKAVWGMGAGAVLCGAQGAAAEGLSGVAALVPAPAALPVPAMLLHALALAGFWAHLLLVTLLLGSVLLAVLDGRAAGAETPGGVAFLPKLLALAVNLGIVPFLFVQVLYGRFLYPGIVLTAVWWLALIPMVMLAYYGLYVGDALPARRRPALALCAALLLGAAFVLTGTLSLAARPALWPAWFAAPGGTMVPLGDPALLPRYAHVVLASLAVGGLGLAWRAQRAARGGANGGWRVRRGLDWFVCAVLAQLPLGALLLWGLPAPVRGLFLGGSLPATATLGTALLGWGAALWLARRGRLRLLCALTCGVLLVMALVRHLARAALLAPYLAASPAPALPLMPHGQFGALGLFAGCAAGAAVLLVWLGRLLYGARRPDLLKP